MVKIINLKTTFFMSASLAESDHQPTESQELIRSNNDLLIEILRYLPPKSILRFKSVSKQWLSLLSHRHFNLQYDNLSISPGLFYRNLYIPFDVETRTPPPFRFLDFHPDNQHIRIVQSCNGLLLCCSNQKKKRSRKYYVFNPTTKQYAVIPFIHGGKDARTNIRFMCLAFHPKECFHYKLVCIHAAITNRGREVFKIQIYSSDTRKWTVTKQSFFAPQFISFRSGMYWNGAIYWAPSCFNPMYFKLDVELLQILPLPPQLPTRIASLGGYNDRHMPLYFGESRGHLHLVDTSHEKNPLHLNIYEMLSDHSGWFIKYQIKLDELPASYTDMIDYYGYPSIYELGVLDVIRGEEDKDTFMVFRTPGHIMKYNVMDKSIKQILNHPVRFGCGEEVHHYLITSYSF